MESDDDVRKLEEEPSLENEAESEGKGEDSPTPRSDGIESGSDSESGGIQGEGTTPGDQPLAPAVSVSGEGSHEPGQDDVDLDAPNVETIMEIEIPVTVTFGATDRPLREILRLAPGSRVELNHRADQPVVLKVNDKPFARGQVVVVDGCYGVKIQEIETTARRIASLGE